MIVRQKLVVSRFEPSTYVDGYPVPGAKRDYDFWASVQPATGKQLESLPEARRNTDAYVLITSFQLKTAEVKSKTNDDRVKLFGEEYEISLVKRWPTHTFAIATKVKQ